MVKINIYLLLTDTNMKGAYHMRGVVYYESERSKSGPYNYI